ncbi:hypothetical protein LOK46_27710 [Methylobacterium sp. NMS14P]|uniref:hypothetical protein n=1 Tax=Methylobacterium sp. NMS14P TaxID=2894310 RepID=UPI002358A7F2|nr:hypothetical protein [Methylobacterium sp. NMS14P]WCS24870.1 hypothetical protein LOK46_27710 [Methylobacterium sp. NMS14P]
MLEAMAEIPSGRAFGGRRRDLRRSEAASGRQSEWIARSEEMPAERLPTERLCRQPKPNDASIGHLCRQVHPDVAAEQKAEDALPRVRTGKRGCAIDQGCLAGSFLDVSGDPVEVAASGDMFGVEDALRVGESGLRAHVGRRNDGDPVPAGGGLGSDRAGTTSKSWLVSRPICRKDETVLVTCSEEADRSCRVAAETGHREKAAELVVVADADGSVHRHQHGRLACETLGVVAASSNPPANGGEGPAPGLMVATLRHATTSIPGALGCPRICEC